MTKWQVWVQGVADTLLDHVKCSGMSTLDDVLNSDYFQRLKLLLIGKDSRRHLITHALPAFIEYLLSAPFLNMQHLGAKLRLLRSKKLLSLRNTTVETIILNYIVILPGLNLYQLPGALTTVVYIPQAQAASDHPHLYQQGQAHPQSNRPAAAQALASIHYNQYHYDDCTLNSSYLGH